jgi:hypothetical protein
MHAINSRLALPALCVALVASVASRPVLAQKATPQQIGTTSVGTPTPVFVEPRSISRTGTVVTATIRVALVPPLKHPKGELRTSRTIGMYDCAKRTVATKESWYYLDEAGTKEGMHRQVKIPGFGPVGKGSVANVALDYLCRAK